jgi:hypothetical protein
VQEQVGGGVCGGAGTLKHSSHVAQHFPAKQKRPDAKSPATLSLPPRFKSPAFVCAVAPVLIGAATLPAGGGEPGSFQAMAAKHNAKTATSAHAATA